MCALCALNAFAQLTGADEIKNVIIHERPLDDAHKMRNGTNFSNYGPTITSGTAKFFGIRISYKGSDYRYANLRFALYNMKKEIVELYEPMRVYLWPDGINGFVIPCKVNAPAGDYYVVPMFRWEEDPENEWTIFDNNIFHPTNDLFDATLWQWKFTVIDDKLPLVNGVKYYYEEEDNVLDIYTNRKFNFFTIINNPHSEDIHGRIKVMHERNIKKFAPGYSYNPEQSTAEFFDCLTMSASMNGIKSGKDGSFNITIKGNEQLSLDFKDLVTDKDYGFYDQFAGQLNLYFLPDGKSDVPENWVMLQENCSTLFDGDELKFKEITEDYWSHVTWDVAETRNQITVILKSNSTETESITSNSIQFDYINGQAIISGLQPGQEVSIISISGKLITSKRSESDNVSISLAGIPSGTYIAVVRTKERTLRTIKFIK